MGLFGALSYRPGDIYFDSGGTIDVKVVKANHTDEDDCTDNYVRWMIPSHRFQDIRHRRKFFVRAFLTNVEAAPRLPQLVSTNLFTRHTNTSSSDASMHLAAKSTPRKHDEFDLSTVMHIARRMTDHRSESIEPTMKSYSDIGEMTN